MTSAGVGAARLVAWCAGACAGVCAGAGAGRRRAGCCLLLLVVAVFTIIILNTANSSLDREEKMEQQLAEMRAHVRYLETMYRARHEELLILESGARQGSQRGPQPPDQAPTLAPEVAALLKNLTGTLTAAGVRPAGLHLRTSFVFQLLPHLMADPGSLRPAYHLRGNRNTSDFVMGIPTVKRDKESYLMITLENLVNGLSPEEQGRALIVVFVGETDLEYVLRLARRIEIKFPKYVKSGLIEVLSPRASYYPELDALAPTLGDSAKRFRWRTKQNLDTLFLMAYAMTRGTYYLMLEDDIICKSTYMQDIKKFTASVSVSNPNWFFIEYCPIGGIGKLFRSSDLLHFITYVQLFYQNMPIDWLLESYLGDRICTIDKSAKNCGKRKLLIRPKFKTSLFQHIGLYSSLKGKIQKVKDSHFGSMPTFYPHANPPLGLARTDIKVHGDHALTDAYLGIRFFWGITPKKGNLVEFWFEKPTTIEKYIFRSGNVEHVSDKFLHTAVEALPVQAHNFTQVGVFDEFGLAEGTIKPELGPLKAIRLRVTEDLTHWVILSEIELIKSEVTESSIATGGKGFKETSR